MKFHKFVIISKINKIKIINDEDFTVSLEKEQNNSFCFFLDLHQSLIVTRYVAYIYMFPSICPCDPSLLG